MRNRIANWIILCIGGALIAIILCPLIYTLAGSFMSSVELNQYYFGGTKIRFLRLIPDRFTLSQYYQALIGNTQYTRALLNSVGFTFLSTAVTLLIALPAAYAFAFCKFPYKRFLIAVYLILMLLPYQAIEMPHFFILRDLGILGTDLSVILTNIFDTFDVVLLTFLFATVPENSLEAASLDGAGVWQTLIYIILPQMKHGIFTVMVLKFINVWNLTEQPILFLEDTSQYPLSVILPELNGSFSASAFAFSIIFILPPVLVYLFFRDSLESTVESGRVKNW